MSVGDRWWDTTTTTPSDSSAGSDFTSPINEATLYDLLQNAAVTGQTPTWFGYPGNTLVEKYNNFITDQAQSKQTALQIQLAQLAKLDQQNAVGAGGNAVGWANLQQRQTEFAADQQYKQAQFAAQQAKVQADDAYNAALLALKQGDAAEARRQFDISAAELRRSHDLDFSLAQQKQNLAQQQFGFDVYDRLSNLAANPRNYMQQFFELRGHPVPPNVGQYSNQVPVQQFLGPFLQSVGLSSAAGAAGPTSPSTSAAPAPSYTGSNGQQYSTPTTADTAMIGGTKVWAGGPYSGMAVDRTPANAGDLTPYLANPNLPDPTGRVPTRMMAKGGTVTMHVPHALVNLLSGRVAAIAGEAGTEHAKFDGAVLTDRELGGTLTSVTPTTDTTTTGAGTGTTLSSLKVPGSPYLAYPTESLSDPYTEQISPSTPLQNPLQPMTPLQPLAPAPSLSGPTLQSIAASTPAPAGYHWEGTRLVADPLTAPTEPTRPVEPHPAPEQPVVFGPQVNPTGTNYWGGPVMSQQISPGVINFTNPFALSSTPSGIGKNPQFLPEDIAQADPIARQMMEQGTFAPFLQRLFAQAKGLPGLGTNVPQATNLPAGVPLASRLALTQMTPAELSAFQSYLSAHGVDWDTYMSLVNAASPQGERQQTAYPKFVEQ